MRGKVVTKWHATRPEAPDAEATKRSTRSAWRLDEFRFKDNEASSSRNKGKVTAAAPVECLSRLSPVGQRERQVASFSSPILFFPLSNPGVTHPLSRDTLRLPSSRVLPSSVFSPSSPWRPSLARGCDLKCKLKYSSRRRRANRFDINGASAPWKAGPRVGREEIPRERFTPPSPLSSRKIGVRSLEFSALV